MSEQTQEQYLAIVLGGMLKDKGMVGFADRLSREDAEAIRSYIASVAEIRPRLAIQTPMSTNRSR